MKERRTRFAPSPTGPLHIGSARIALINALLARRKKSTFFLLRFDDTAPGDIARIETYKTGIRDDLAWLGLKWEREIHQSTRIKHYEEAAQRLKAQGLLYPCYESQAELELKRRSARALGTAPIYDRQALKLSETERSQLEAEGNRPHWRLKLEGKTLDWQDKVRGWVSFEVAKLSDPVLIRADGSFLYHLPSVVDDIEEEIDLVIRGEDHVANTAVHIALFQALGAQLPEFAHLPLLVDNKGAKLSKRSGGDCDLANLRLFEPGVVRGFLVSFNATAALTRDWDSLADHFDLDAIGRAPLHFDQEALLRLNAEHLGVCDHATISSRLAEVGADDVDALLWQTARSNIRLIDDILIWRRICRATISPIIAPEDTAWLTTAAHLLPEEPWESDVWPRWIHAVKSITSRRRHELFYPLRLALTGRHDGPSLQALLALIGRKRAIERLTGACAE